MIVPCGIDIATITGLTVIKDGAFDATTYRSKRPKKDILEQTSKMPEPKWEGPLGRDFEDFLISYFVLNGVTHAAIEAPLPSNNTFVKKTVDFNASFAGQSVKKEEKGGTSMRTMYRLYGLSMMAAVVCSRLNIPCYMVAQQTWRKEFLGNGRPPNAKNEAVKMCQKMNIPITSVDAAESVGIAYWLNMQINPSSASDDLFHKGMTAAAAQARKNAEKHFKN